MTFQSIPNAVECVINGSSGGKAIAHVLHFQFPGAYSQSDLDLLALDMDDWVHASYKAVFSVNVTYISVHVRGLTSPIDLEATNATNTGVGSVTGASTTNNVSACITLRSGKTGRSARGRFYAWPTGTSKLTSVTEFDATYMGDVAAALQAINAAVSGSGWTWVIASRRNNGAVRPVGVTLPVLDVEARNVLIDSQRGRLTQGH